MKIQASRIAKGVALAALVASVSACTLLPRSGPSKSEIYSGSVQREGDAFIVSVDPRVNQITSVTPALGFSESFRNAGLVGSDTINAGDTLGITIYENVDDPLLGGEGRAPANLEQVQVDGDGFIFIPYAGRVKASGNSPEALRRVITTRLDAQTPDPQVQVRRLAGDGSTVSLAGAVGGQGVYPIQRPTRTLSAMLASAGGVSVEPNIAQITVIRGAHRGKVWFEDLYEFSELDIALRGGDKILVEADQRTYTTMGATGGQTRVPFATQNLSAIEAIATAGGLQSNTADPTGVFVFRNESEEIARQVMNREDLIGAQRLIYVLDLTQPNGMFDARDFLIRDGDTVYVTEAPFVTWDKTISALLGSLNQVASTSNIATNF